MYACVRARCSVRTFVCEQRLHHTRLSSLRLLRRPYTVTDCSDSVGINFDDGILTRAGTYWFEKPTTLDFEKLKNPKSPNFRYVGFRLLCNFVI